MALEVFTAEQKTIIKELVVNRYNLLIQDTKSDKENVLLLRWLSNSLDKNTLSYREELTIEYLIYNYIHSNPNNITNDILAIKNIIDKVINDNPASMYER